VLASALALTSLGTLAAPASALPLVGIGANVGAAVHIPSTGSPAADLTADLAVLGPVIGLQYWQPFNGTSPYMQGGVRFNVSPIPMINVAPGLAACSVNGAIGGLATLNASFSPLMLPVSVDGAIGAGYAGGSPLLPYHAGVKLSLIPFTAINVRYRGWTGNPAFTFGGPEIGIEIGL
jgi:hypothetical protein